MTAFYSFIAAFIFFLYTAMAPVLDFAISPDFKTYAWGLACMALGFLSPMAGSFRNRRQQ